MAKKQPTEENNVLSIAPLETGVAKFCILGMTPLVQNRMAEKARQELLYPRGGRLSSADKVARLKHNPIEEFRSAAHAPKDKEYPTRLIIPAGAFRKALAEAALDTPGAAKAQIMRLTWILAESGGTDIPVFGLPELFMSVVRMSDRNRTPDIRTRPILPRWACYLSVRYLKPQLTAATIGNLLARAGLLIGIGDGRHEKSGDFGMFELCAADDSRFLEIVNSGARAAQDAAFANPVPYDSETEEQLSWFKLECVRRERKAEEGKEERKKAPVSSNSRRHPLAGVEA
jgi:hypothetical protein